MGGRYKRVVQVACFALGIMLLGSEGSGRSVTAAEPVLEKVTTTELASVLRQIGFEVEMLASEDANTPASLRARTKDVDAYVRLFECGAERPHACSEILVFANFELGAPLTDETKARINSYNETNRIGRAYYLLVKDGSPTQIGIDLRVRLKNGVTAAHLNASLREWMTALDLFTQHMS